MRVSKHSCCFRFILRVFQIRKAVWRKEVGGIKETRNLDLVTGICTRHIRGWRWQVSIISQNFHFYLKIIFFCFYSQNWNIYSWTKIILVFKYLMSRILMLLIHSINILITCQLNSSLIIFIFQPSNYRNSRKIFFFSFLVNNN